MNFPIISFFSGAVVGGMVTHYLLYKKNKDIARKQVTDSPEKKASSESGVRDVTDKETQSDAKIVARKKTTAKKKAAVKKKATARKKTSVKKKVKKT